MTVEVTAAGALSAAVREKIERFARRKFGEDAAVVYLEDASVIGGIRLRAGDEVYDGTLGGRLKDLGAKL